MWELKAAFSFSLALTAGCDWLSEDQPETNSAPADSANPAPKEKEGPSTPPSSTSETPPKKAEPQLKYYGKAADELKALYASLEPSTKTPAELSKEAWRLYKDKKFHEAMVAFARLSQLEPEPWKHPYNAACAAAGRSEVDRAQFFLTEAIRRGGDVVREKARGDQDLDALRARDYFGALIGASETELAGWEIREPNFGLKPFAPQDAGLAIHEVSAKPLPPTTNWYSSDSLEISFKLTRGKGANDRYDVASTCKSHGRYLRDRSTLTLKEVLDEVQTVNVEAFGNAWNGSRDLTHCEMRLVESRFREVDRQLASYCFHDGAVADGTCQDFDLPRHREIVVAEFFANAMPDQISGRPRVDIWVALELGYRPDFLKGLTAAVRCKVGGKVISRELPAGGADLARPGETYQKMLSTSFDKLPQWCEVEYFLRAFGPRVLPEVPTYCHIDGALLPYACPR